MAKCVIFSGTRICSGSPYRVNSRPKQPFPRLTRAERRRRQPARDAINALDIPVPQRKLANDLLDVVLAADWSGTKTSNSKDVRESVQLFLVDEVGKLQGKFTLIAY